MNEFSWIRRERIIFPADVHIIEYFDPESVHDMGGVPAPTRTILASDQCMVVVVDALTFWSKDEVGRFFALLNSAWSEVQGNWSERDSASRTTGEPCRFKTLVRGDGLEVRKEVVTVRTGDDLNSLTSQVMREAHALWCGECPATG